MKLHLYWYSCFTIALIALKFYSVCGIDDDSHSNIKQLFERKLRHSRHARNTYVPFSESSKDDNVSSSQFQQESINNKLTIVQDNHKPSFSNCLSYQPTIKEEEPTGTFVIQVKASDSDPPERGGTINYSFVAAAHEQMKFTIDSLTGVIRTKYMFNWDEPNRERTMYLTVRATDNGRPQLDDICTFKVVIEDINDNAPTFDKVSYEEPVPQDMKPGSEVMRISATDIDDGNNSLIVYDLTENMSSKDLSEDKQYFQVNRNTGIVYLKKEIDKELGYKFRIRASATDQSPTQPKTSIVELVITVVESNKKAPYFTQTPSSPIRLLENFTDASFNIATFVAESNTDERIPIFQLVNGKTEQTNKLNTFRLITDENTANIRLGGNTLDYEQNKEYLLTVRVQNKYKLAAEQLVIIELIDVNDNFPVFTKEVTSGSVLENEPIGTFVMQVKAVDADKTPLFSKITYELEDNTDNFEIDRYTGSITTKVKFDREEIDVYNVKVVAKDGAPSSRLNNGQPNSDAQVFSIEIADRNDHYPKFRQSSYEAIDIPENDNINALVTEVKADDEDSASKITYSIIDGNVGDAFYIEPETGRIKVKNRLDFESVTNYTLKVIADDGRYKDECRVEIKILNVNDNPPVFYEDPRSTRIDEETPVNGCIITVRAYDPDIPDKNAPQNIVYFIVKEEQKKLITINKTGCLSLIKPLDRDPPNGYDTWQVLIAANDDNAAPNSLRSTIEVVISLNDINDNAPYLNVVQPVIWYENQKPGTITKLTAADNDSPTNGAPFSFELSSRASNTIREKFDVKDSLLIALQEFDREEQKVYHIPVTITDSGMPPRGDTSILTVVIGDVNDNPMKEGNSSIFVYTFEDSSPDMEIGRVYVNDPDDWDLPDKEFKWLSYRNDSYFSLNKHTGMITMKQGTPSQSYILNFTVKETPKTNLFPSQSVKATVNVKVKKIPEEAVDKSGSIRFEFITAEEFVMKDSIGKSKIDELRSQLALALNNSEENIDVFTVMHSPYNNNSSELDVRFSAHGSPYYSPERINTAVVNHQDEIEKSLNLKMLMINVDECLIEKLYCESSCSNYLHKTNVSAPVFTNKTSFVGINAYIEPVCECKRVEQVCLNGGTMTSVGRCSCPENFDGPNCEYTSIGFSGDGYALYPTFDSCETAHITLYVRATDGYKDGLIFYIGPDSLHPSSLGVNDFMSLELRKGYLLLLVDYGSGAMKINHLHSSIADNNFHKIEIILSTNSIELIVDNCKMENCFKLLAPIGTNKYLNVNRPLQLGGTWMDLIQVANRRNWLHKPTHKNFVGCIRNFTFNEKSYNLGYPEEAKNVDLGCSSIAAETITFGFDWTFLTAILICIAVFTMLLMFMAVHRRKVEEMYKDTDDIRENIINYEDEGGGEGDMTGFDMNVLRLQYDTPIGDKYMNGMLPTAGVDEVPDMCGFLDSKKHIVDNDPETLPFDDVRHYAYEGDGNTSGSLSSLASGTDEGDLNFDYLSNFGPRFRKLADMYGEDASDEDSDTYHNATSESWC